MGSIERNAFANILIVAVSIFGFAISADAQTKRAKQTKKPAAKQTIVRSIVTGFPRERFDPRRDPFKDLDAAIARATRENKRIILDVGGEWCGWCIYMDRFFYERPEIARIRDANYVWVKVNMSPENENRKFLSGYPEISGYPHLFVLDSDGTFLHSQSTGEFENRDGYIPEIVAKFLNDWSPQASENVRNN